MKMNTDKTEVQYIGEDAVGIDVSVDGETISKLRTLSISEGR